MRNWQGQVLCYDLRDHPPAAVWDLRMQPSAIGLARLAKPLRLFEHTLGCVDQGTSRPATAAEVGLPNGTWRRTAEWEPFECPDLKVAGGRLSGSVPMDFGTIDIPIGLDLAADAGGAVTGIWTRTVPAGKVMKKSGALTGTAEAGGIVLSLEAVTPSEKPQRVDVHLTLDGGKVVRAVGAAGPWSQSWHEVDARGLKVVSADRIEGDLVLILNWDKWLHRWTPCPGTAGRIHLAARRQGDAWSGTWTAVWGEPYTFTGTVTGIRTVGRAANPPTMNAGGN
jgi:hypothetical protein